MALSHYIITTEHARFVFKIDGAPDDNAKSSDTDTGNPVDRFRPPISAVDRLVLTDETGKQIYDSDLSKVQVDFFSVSKIYETSNGVFLEIALNGMAASDRMFLCPTSKRIGEIDGVMEMAPEKVVDII